MSFYGDENASSIDGDDANNQAKMKACHISASFYKKFREKMEAQQLFSCQRHSWMLNSFECKTMSNPPLGLANETKLTDSYDDVS